MTECTCKCGNKHEQPVYKYYALMRFEKSGQFWVSSHNRSTPEQAEEYGRTLYRTSFVAVLRLTNEQRLGLCQQLADGCDIWAKKQEEADFD